MDDTKGRYHMTMTDRFVILQDDREKGGCNSRTERAFDFSAFPCSVKRAHLAQGDYSVEGYDGRFSVERKSPGDLVATLYGSHILADGTKKPNVERFAGELQRLEQYDHVYVAITGTERDVALAAQAHAEEVRRRTGKMWPANSEMVFNLAASLSAEFAIPFIFFNDVATAERAVYRDFRAWVRQAEGKSHVRKYRVQTEDARE